jgi:hypothetical protein
MPLETTATLDSTLKDVYLSSPQARVRQLVRTSKRPTAERAPLSVHPVDEDERRLQKLLARVRKLRLMAKQLWASIS